VEILLWLVPPVLVTVVAMLWVGWVGRDRRELDRDEAVRRMGAALEKQPRVQAPAPRARERSTGVALRRTPRTARRPAVPKAPERPAASGRDAGHESDQRRAS
jgi:hypothetical protein